MRTVQWLIRAGIVTSLLLLGLPQVQAQDDTTPTVYVISGMGCSFSDAIEAANQDKPVGACPAGNGADVIQLLVNISHVGEGYTPPILPGDDSVPHYVYAIPDITSSITIDGQGHTFSINARSTLLGYFNVLKSADAGNSIGDGALTLKNLTLGGWGTPDNTAGISNNGGTVVLDNMTMRYLGGGAIKSSGGEIQIDNSRFLNNQAEDGGAIYAYNTSVTIRGAEFHQNQGGNGGAIFLQSSPFDFAAGTDDLIFDDNSASEQGGAIFSMGSSGIVRHAILQNNRAKSGGAIYHGHTLEHSLIIMDSRFVGNQAVFDNSTNESVESIDLQGGGAIFNGGQLVVKRSVFWTNNATDGGAILQARPLAPNAPNEWEGVLLVNSSSFIGNSAGRGGALFIEWGGQIVNSTIFNNTSLQANGGGIFVPNQTSLYNTIISDNSGGDCFILAELQNGSSPSSSEVFTGDHNLDSDDSCPNAEIAIGLEEEPMYNGGGTITIALLEGSNAIDGGDPEFCSGIDQRGAPIVGICDIGAFEFGAMQLPVMRDPNRIDYTISEEQIAQEAREAYERGAAEIASRINSDPNNPVLYFERGSYHLHTGDNYAAALADFEQALVLDPTYADAQFNIAAIYIYTWQFHDCLKGREEIDHFIALVSEQTGQIQTLENQFRVACETSAE